jgi:hypothetical protein
MKRGFTILTLALAFAAGGCTKFPYGASFDRHNFVSTPSRPMTIILEDALTREELLRIDVPIGKKVVIDFDHKTDWAAGPSSAMPAEEVRWQVFPPDKTFSGKLRNQMRLSGNPVRIRQEIREPQSMVEAREPDYQPAEGPGGDAAGEATPRYQPREADQPPAEGGPGEDDPARPEGPEDAGDQIAPERGPATREPVDEPQPEVEGEASPEPAGDERGDEAAAPEASDLEEALEAGGSDDGQEDAGPRYVPSEDDGEDEEALGATG